MNPVSKILQHLSQDDMIEILMEVAIDNFEIIKTLEFSVAVVIEGYNENICSYDR